MNYHEILAQHYEENARNLLVHQQDYPEDEQGESVEPDHGVDKNPDELENQEAFNSFAPRNENTLPTPAPYNAANAKNYKTHVLNVDSRFRAYQSITSKQNQLNMIFPPGNESRTATLVLNPVIAATGFTPSSSTNFAVRFGKQYRNIISAKLTTTEIPNTSYNFLDLYQNKTFTIVDQTATYVVTIPSGNYTIGSLVTAIELNEPFATLNYTIVYEPNSHKIAITGPADFTADFTSGNTSSPFLNGLGYHLGFVNQIYDNTSPNYSGNTLTAENVPDLYWNNYCYLVINDWDVVQHQDFNQSHFYAFAKIVMNGDKNNIIYDTNVTNTSTKEYIFSNPSNVETIIIKLLDPYGNPLDLNGANFSFSLELREVLNMGAYEAAREF